MNRLQHETSPYLLQHAHNPVDWYAWKPEAFEKAKQENKPILVSIGYSTCHWCHVMERESFENERVAAFMNENFVNIKVDREERPDVDQIYMEACQAISGSGGWPLNCFLLPDGRPYYAGTYYPPKPMRNRPSWVQLLQHMIKVYKEEPDKVLAQAKQLTEIVQNSDTTFFPGSNLGLEKDDQFDLKSLDGIFQKLKQSFDIKDGGFGGAPKFPGTMSLEFLLQYHFYTKNQEALDHVHLSLTKMIKGGIYDQLGGGFARYATDKAWLVPHFEKMLYDNALLVSLLSDAYLASSKGIYKNTIEECLDFIKREMTHPDGGFYSALDADSEGEEGKFYVWSKYEIESFLDDKKVSDIFCYYYGVSDEGNWEGKNILWRPVNLDHLEKKFELSKEEIKDILEKSRQKLLEERSWRIRPGLDDKILLNWNALQLIAYIKAFKALGHREYLETALKNHHFLKEAFIQEDGLHFFHTHKNGKSQYDAFLDDYTYWIAALLELYTVTFDLKLLEEAKRYTNLVLQDFYDEKTGFFFYTSEKQKDLPVRRKELFDSSVPSGNSTMLKNLTNLGILLNDTKYHEVGLNMLSHLKQAIERYPSSFSRWAQNLLQQTMPYYEIAVIGSDAESKALELQKRFLPSITIMASADGDKPYPLLEGRKSTEETLIYICREYACGLPQKNVEAAIQEIVGQNA